MVTSDFRLEVEIRPFRACTMKNMQYNLINGRITKISASVKKSGWGTRWWCKILDRKWEYDHYAHAQWEISKFIAELLKKICIF